MSKKTQGEFSEIKNLQEVGKKYWSKNWFQVVPPKYVLVKRGIFGSIKAVAKVLDVPSDKKIERTQCVTEYEIRGGEDKPYQRKKSLIIDLTDKDLESLIKYYEKTSRNNYLEIANAEKIYREKVREYVKLNGGDANTIYKNREHMELVPKAVADLISNPLTTLYERRYPIAQSDIRKIKRTEAKRGLRLRLPFQQMMLISTAERNIETVKVSLLEQREVSFDVDPVISIVDPETYVEKLQSEDYHLDERILFKDIGSRVNSIFSNYFSSRGIESFSKMDSGQMAADQDLCWDLALLGMEFGIKFHLTKFRVKRYNTAEVLKAESEKAAADIKLGQVKNSYDMLVEQGFSKEIAALIANNSMRNTGKENDGKNEFGNLANTIITIEALRNGLGGFGGFGVPQQTQTQQIITKSGKTIEQLESLGLCDSRGALDQDTMNSVLALRGLPPESCIIFASDLTEEEINHLYRQKRGKTR